MPRREGDYKVTTVRNNADGSKEIRTSYGNSNDDAAGNLIVFVLIGLPIHPRGGRDGYCALWGNGVLGVARLGPHVGWQFWVPEAVWLHRRVAGGALTDGKSVVSRKHSSARRVSEVRSGPWPGPC